MTRFLKILADCLHRQKGSKTLSWIMALLMRENGATKALVWRLYCDDPSLSGKETSWVFDVKDAHEPRQDMMFAVAYRMRTNAIGSSIRMSYPRGRVFSYHTPFVMCNTLHDMMARIGVMARKRMITVISRTDDRRCQNR